MDAVSGTDAASGRPLVRFIGVRKTFDGRTLVVRRLDLDVLEGEFLTLLGPSGSGKTTTLMMLAGFETPSEGEITLGGRSLAHLPPHKRDIGVVFQNYALFPHMTVAENVAFPLAARRVGRTYAEARVARALDMVRLGGLGHRRPAQLSGGQQQRVALARALVFEPRLVLMDEPLGALDKQLREEMQLEIRRIHERLGVTFVYVTHDQGEALTLSDRIAVFNDGAIRQLDTPRALYEAPLNAFVARFIGENNRIAGTHAGTEGAMCAVRVAAGALVRARPVDLDGVGGQATLSIRPERIRLGPGGGAPGPSTNEFPAEVREVIYLGDHVRVRVAALGVDEINAKVPVSRLAADVTPGAAVTIAWDAADCQAFKPE